MADTRSGVPGLPVAAHAQEELSNALVHAPIPCQETEEETVVDWGEIQNQRIVTRKVAQVNILHCICSYVTIHVVI